VLKFKYIIFLICLCFLFKAQNVVSSKVYINTCYQDHQCFSFSNGAYIFYDEGSHDLYVKIDFALFKTGNDSLDAWIKDLEETKLLFKGYLSAEKLVSLSQHNYKSTIINGLIYFNNTSHAHSIEFTMFEISDAGILRSDNKNDYFDRINANLQFSFSPKEFKLNKKPHHLKKPISIAIYRGYINPIKPGMDFWIKP